MHFKNLLKVSCFILLSLFSLQSIAQTVVTGKVTDSKDGSGIPGASVVAKGTTVGTVTDVNGSFRLSVASSVTTLTVSYVGYTTKDVTLTGAPLNVALEPTSTSLNEVLVIGYGTVRKKDATGAVVKVNAGDFVQGVTTNPLQQLQGQAPGVVITTSSGDPNDAPTVRIRGTTSLSGGNDPLYVIDGVAGADIRSVSPNDIESFTIEKDASAAAIYGSRAAGGVILVTTKTGKAGKSQVTFNSYVASESPEHLIKFMDRNQYLSAYQDFYGHAMPTGTSTTSDQGANTDWFREITRTGFTHNENLALSGGTEQGHYRASVAYTDQDGIAINSGRKDLYGRFNFDQKTLDNKLLITMNVSGSQTNSLFTDKNAFLNAAAVPSVIGTMDPVNAGYYQYINNTQENNPIPQLIYLTNIGRQDRLTGNLRMDFNPIKQITISPYVNAAHGVNVTNIYYPPAIALSPVGGLLNAVGDQFGYTPQLSNHGDVDKGSSDYTNKTYGATIAYKDEFGKLRVSALGGYEFNSFDYSGFRVGAHDFNDIYLPDENLGSANSISTADIGSDRGGYQLKSWFGRAELNWSDKYYLTGNVRYDWSNKLGLNNQSGVFPSVDAAWVISNEDFMKGVSWISSLKLRGGYGQIGNQDAIGPYLSQFLFSSGNLYYNGALGQFVSSSSPVQNQNADLRWQVNTTTNVAVDFSLFNSRLTGSLDIYSEKTKHLLFTYTVPTGSTFFVNTIVANIGSMSNKGFELSLNYKIISKSDFTWTAGGNFNVNRNKIVSLSGQFAGLDFNVTQANVGSTGGLGISGQISQIGYLKVGYPIGTLLLPEYAGKDASGNQQFWKYNADGSRTAVTDVSLLNYADDGSTQDRKFYTTDPKFTYGLSSNLTYKQFDLSIFARGQYGSKGFNETYMDYTSLAKLGTYSVLADASKLGIKSSSEPSNYWLQGTSFLKIQSVNVGYSLKINQNRYIDKLHFYVGGNNLYTFTSYKGVDPELTTAGGQTGIDSRQLYPRSRQLSFGVNLTLK
ncbi:SusC/RagA family TonB-linked outer membrane protein [Mucilaginibacter sp.]|jgi:iron complex outermembrane receptor protein|uniref:SusC/RagA family TonB-linked outer membrane protein n=1 Tax=Mucilaginibacter sp. TaxID=1882438 RepID=UPI002CB69EF7|nr:SusC/RagA family TonB-linked outer membrane protein [Mucilaginibacter sp.]HTI60817.1 SusC/RagA family TonB-linked outer membrane protein [Mucilaginibacter sp.]